MKNTPFQRASTTFCLVVLSFVFSAHESLCHPTEQPKPKNIIFVIGDGMGPQQIGFADLYASRTPGESTSPLSRFVRKAAMGSHSPSADGNLVNDSACSATEMAAACLCKPRQIGITTKGDPCRTLFQDAKQRGMRVGLISDTRITHATPAAFFAHAEDRGSEHVIAEQLLSSDIDLALSGGRSFFLPAKSSCTSPNCQGRTDLLGDRPDGKNLLDAFKKRGFSVLGSAKDLESATTLPVLGLFARDFMKDAFDEGRDGEPTLALMTQKALRLLDGSQGFILMVEAGQIDLASHHNDAGWVLAEMHKLSSTLAVIEDFTRARNDTLVILTGDHETGGMGFSYYYPRNLPLSEELGSPISAAVDAEFVSDAHLMTLRNQRASVLSAMRTFQQLDKSQRTAEKLKEIVQSTANLPLSRSVAEWIANLVNGDVSPHDAEDTLVIPFYPKGSAPTALLGRALGAQSGVVWASGNHTSTPVFVFSTGPGSARLQGWFNTLELGQRLKAMIE